MTSPAKAGAALATGFAAALLTAASAEATSQPPYGWGAAAKAALVAAA